MEKCINISATANERAVTLLALVQATSLQKRTIVMRKLGILMLVGTAVLVTQFTGGESFHLGRSLSITTDDSTENHAKNLNTSTEDGLELLVQHSMHPAVHHQTPPSAAELPLSSVQQAGEDDYNYDDYSWDDGPAEFVDLDAIIQPTSVDRTPVTGLFKLAHSNDWVVVEHYFMDHYYFGNLGADLSTKKFVWQPVGGEPFSVGSESAGKLGAEIKKD